MYHYTPYNKTEVDAKITEVDLSNYYTKSETYTKTEVDNKITDSPGSLWTLENDQTLSYTNPNADTNYPALSLRHDAISKGGNLNCSVLRLINERDDDWAPFVMFAGKNNKRLGEIIYNPMLGYLALESGLNSLSSVRMYLDEDKVSIQTLVNYSDVPYALQTYSYSKSESDNKYALKTDIPTVPFNVVDNMIEPTKTLNFTLDNFKTSREYVRFNNIIGQKIVKWLIKDNGFGGGDAILEFACDVENSVNTLMQFVDYKSVVRIPNLYKNETVKYLTNEDLTTTLSDYVSNTNLSTQLLSYYTKEETYTKTESDEKYVLKNEPIEMNTVSGERYAITISGNQRYTSNYIKFVADKDYDNIQFTIDYQMGDDYGLIFSRNGTDLLRLNNANNSVMVNTIKNMSGVEYALKSDIPEVPFNVVDNMIEPTKTLNFTLDNFSSSKEFMRIKVLDGTNMPEWIIRDKSHGGSDGILEFACSYNDKTLMQFIDYNGTVRIPDLYKNETVKYLTNEDLTTTLSDYVSSTNLSTQLSNYALKSELADTSNYYVKRPNIEFSYVVDYGDQMSFTFMNSTENVAIFSVNHNVLGKSLLFSHNQDKGVMISEIGQNILFGIQQNGALTFTQKLRHTNDMQSFVEYVTSTELQQSMTITHLAPIDEELDINSFVIGAPVYMTGKVYVKENNTWHKSTVNDSIDCIPSVKTNGTWKEYLGICTHILPETREIKFATHGDYLVKVDDSSTYGIGDTVYIEHVIRDNVNIPVLKILSEDIPLTTKINRMTVGVVTSIIDSKTISVIKD